MPSDADILAFLNRADNFLYALNWRQGNCEFVPAARAALSELPFLDHRTLGQSRKKGTLPLERVLSGLRGGGFAHRGLACDFIFHTAFCNSTLLARLVDTPGRVLALKEPLALLGLSALSRAGLANYTEWAEASLKLLSRPFTAGERTLIKPSNGANNLLPLFPGQPGVGKILLLYGPLDGFLLAVIGGGPARQEFVDAIFEHSVRDAGESLGNAKALGPLERAAVAWGLQMRSFDSASRAAGTNGIKTLNGARLLENPKAALEAVNGYFGYGISSDALEEKVQGPLLTRYAKDLSLPFDAAAAERERAALRARHSGAIEAAMALATENGLAFPQGLPNSLI